MKHHEVTALGLVLLMLALVASPAVAQTVANGPYYATPSWDQTLPSSTRFIVLANMASAAVLDRETGVVWERSPLVGSFDWAAATDWCLTKTTGNRSGWRLPTINEFGSLFDPSLNGSTSTSAPPLPPGHPFTGLPAPALFGTTFWSATPAPTNGFYRAYGYEIFDIGFPGSDLRLYSLLTTAPASYQASVWCVRGGVFSGMQ